MMIIFEGRKRDREGRKRTSHSSYCHILLGTISFPWWWSFSEAEAVQQWRLLNPLVTFKARGLVCFIREYNLHFPTTGRMHPCGHVHPCIVTNDWLCLLFPVSLFIIALVLRIIVIIIFEANFYRFVCVQKDSITRKAWPAFLKPRNDGSTVVVNVNKSYKQTTS